MPGPIIRIDGAPLSHNDRRAEPAGVRLVLRGFPAVPPVRGVRVRRFGRDVYPTESGAPSPSGIPLGFCSSAVMAGRPIARDRAMNPTVIGTVLVR